MRIRGENKFAVCLKTAKVCVAENVRERGQKIQVAEQLGTLGVGAGF